MLEPVAFAAGSFFEMVFSALPNFLACMAQSSRVVSLTAAFCSFTSIGKPEKFVLYQST